MLSLRQEDWDRVAERIAKAEGPIAWAWLAVRERELWHLLVLTVRGCTPSRRRLLRYPNVAFGTDRLAPRTAAKRFREGSVRFRPDSDLVFRPEGHSSAHWHTTEASGLHLTRGDWPRYVARFHRSVNNVNVPDRNDPLTAPGQPYYANLMVAASELLYGVQPAYLGNDLSSNVTVVLPDRRARFRDIRFDEGMTFVRIERGDPAARARLLLRASWREEPEDAEWLSHDQDIDSDEVRIPTQGIPAHMSIAISDPSGFVLDRREWDPARHERPQEVIASAEQIQRWLSEGESTTLECKEDVTSDSARRSFAETVAAFANGFGGVILLGVTKDYHVVGYNPDFSVVDQVTSIVDALVSEPPVLRVDRVDVDGSVVHAVRVEPSDPEGRPHVVREKVYYRANSRTRVAFPSEIRRMTRIAPQPHRLGLLGL